MKRLSKVYGCPLELALEVLGGKWKTVLLGKLTVEPMAYGELRRSISTLSDKMLSERLRDLTDAGLIERTVESDRERYRLTDLGETLRPMLIGLYDWGQALAQAREVRFRTTRAERPSAAAARRLRAV